jgi:polyisoprenoid-binding protein YceI
MTNSPTLPVAPGVWNIDPAHSSVAFVARHLMVSKVRGTFASFNGTIVVGDDLGSSRVEATVDVASITTGDDGRDQHLRSSDFFDLDQHPTWRFASTEVRVAGERYALVGELTIKGVTRTVEFALDVEGVATDPWGATKAGFSASAEISRKDFGLEWNVALETGGVLVGDKVKIELDIQAVQAL